MTRNPFPVCRPPLLTVALAVVSSGAPVVAVPASAQIEVVGASILELQEAMASGRATSAGLTRAYLDRIAAYDQQGPALNTMIWINRDAVDQAEVLDRERVDRGPRGPMHGIPIIVKDNYDTADLPTSAGSVALAGNVAPDDAFQVARLREAGAVILGKTNMHELASGITTISSLGGQTLNPYDPTRNPGGSSGGTGAAVAASFAAVGWGSDTCGSIRIPAAQNDLVGLRPSKGLSSIDGIIPLSHTQDVGGPLARSVTDLAIALDATVGPDPADPATVVLTGTRADAFVSALEGATLEGTRIGILEEYFGTAPEEGAAARLVRESVAVMVELGADTVTVAISDLSDLISGTGLINHEFKWDFIDYLAGNPDAPVSSLTEMLESGLIHEALVPRMRIRDQPETRDSEDYRRALARREPLRAAVEETLNRHSLDVLVFPTVRTVPAVIGQPQRGSSCSLSANTGLPSISVPVGFADGGLPIGMEMIGRFLNDHALVAMAYAFESATDHRREPRWTPPLVDGGAPAEATLASRPVDVSSSSTATLTVNASFDPVSNRLRYRFETEGVGATDVYAVVMRHTDEEGEWQVVERLSGPGVQAGQGVVSLSDLAVDRLTEGALEVRVLTRGEPFGAASVTLGRD